MPTYLLQPASQLVYETPPPKKNQKKINNPRSLLLILSHPTFTNQRPYNDESDHQPFHRVAEEHLNFT